MADGLPQGENRKPFSPAPSSTNIAGTSREHSRVGFTLGSETFACLESFAQAIRLPESDHRRAYVAGMSRSEAKEFCRNFEPPVGGSVLIYWEGELFAARSEAHHKLMAQAVAAEREARGYLPNPKHTTANIVSFNPLYSQCSNFAHTPFKMGGIQFQSVEAFVHFIKFFENDPRRKDIPNLHSSEARRAGSEIGKEIKAKLTAGEDVFVCWQGTSIRYRSPEHEALLADAIWQKFQGSPEAQEQLLYSGDKEIIHNTGRRESPMTSLPADVFCRILTDIRSRLRGERE